MPICRLIILKLNLCNMYSHSSVLNYSSCVYLKRDGRLCDDDENAHPIMLSYGRGMYEIHSAHIILQSYLHW